MFFFSFSSFKLYFSTKKIFGVVTQFCFAARRNILDLICCDEDVVTIPYSQRGGKKTDSDIFWKIHVRKIHSHKPRVVMLGSTPKLLPTTNLTTYV